MPYRDNVLQHPVSRAIMNATGYWQPYFHPLTHTHLGHGESRTASRSLQLLKETCQLESTVILTFAQTCRIIQYQTFQRTTL
jgi:hypothetical protein